MKINKIEIEDSKEVQHRKSGLIVRIKVNINNGEENKYAITVKRKDTLDQIAKQNHKMTKEDQKDNLKDKQEANNSNSKVSKKDTIIAEKLDINRINAELG